MSRSVPSKTTPEEPQNPGAGREPRRPDVGGGGAPGPTAPEDFIALRFRPKWSMIESVREMSRAFCMRERAGEDLASRVEVIVQETLENAVKYSQGAQTANDLQLDIEVDEGKLLVAVSNLADPSQLEMLRSELERMQDLDPEAAYIEACERAMLNPSARSRLGLARTRFEGRVDLSLEEQANGRVRLTARGQA